MISIYYRHGECLRRVKILPSLFMYCSNGDQYEGDWVAGNRHGSGMLRCADGTLYDVRILSIVLCSRAPLF